MSKQQCHPPHGRPLWVPDCLTKASDEDQAVVEIDMNRCEQVRRWWPFLRDRRIDSYTDITKRFID